MLKPEHQIVKGSKITDTVENEVYSFKEFYENDVILEHLPKGRRNKLDNWTISWDEFIKKVEKKEISVHGFTDEEQYQLFIVIESLNVKVNLEEKIKKLKQQIEDKKKLDEERRGKEEQERQATKKRLEDQDAEIKRLRRYEKAVKTTVGNKKAKRISDREEKLQADREAKAAIDREIETAKKREVIEAKIELNKELLEEAKGKDKERIEKSIKVLELELEKL